MVNDPPCVNGILAAVLSAGLAPRHGAPARGGPPQKPEAKPAGAPARPGEAASGKSAASDAGATRPAQ